MKIKIFAAFFIVFALCLNTFGQNIVKTTYEDSPVKSANTQFFPLEHVKEGLKGKAWTVFRGTQAEPFDVEILGILPGGVGPKQDLIIGKISGGEADRTQVFAGMSGSPVYIDGKLVGAISYSFPFSKEAICGITPIEQMITIFEKNLNEIPRVRNPRKFSFGELASTDWKPNFPSSSTVSSSIVAGANPNSALNSLVGQTLQPIATPLSFNGFSQAALNEFAPQLMQFGLMPVAAVGGASKITALKKATDKTLVGGTSVTMQLSRGDYSMAASGTVTFRDGEKIYAFGHPFLGLGSSDLPMSESSVVTVVPNINNSFKLAVPNSMVGSMTQDRATGVYGKLGTAPKMIPVKINLTTSRNQKETLNFEIANDDALTPLLLNIGIFNAVVSNEREMGDLMIEVDGEIKIKGHDSIKIERRYAGQVAARFASIAMVIPVANLMGSRFDDLDISEITLNLNSIDGSKTADLERIAINKTEVRAGDEIEIQAFVRTDSGKVMTQNISVKIPADTPTGKLMIVVGDGNSIQAKSASQQFVPNDLSELITKINDLKKNDRLYVQTYRVTKGAIIGSSEMPNLPPSVLATLNTNRTAGGIKPTVQTVLTEQEIAPADFIISGQQSLEIEVIK